jgi:hypothetical protein
MTFEAGDIFFACSVTQLSLRILLYAKTLSRGLKILKIKILKTATLFVFIYLDLFIKIFKN